MTFPNFRYLTQGQNKSEFTCLHVRLISSLIYRNQISPQQFSFHNIVEPAKISSREYVVEQFYDMTLHHIHDTEEGGMKEETL